MIRVQQPQTVLYNAKTRQCEQRQLLTLIGQNLVHAAARHRLDEGKVAPPQHLLL